MKRMSDYLSELGNLGFFYEMEAKKMSKYIIGGLVSSLFIYSLGATYLLCQKQRGFF